MWTAHILNHVECRLYRVGLSADGWQPPQTAADVDPELAEFAKSYISDIPPYGGWTPDDWSVTPAYCSTDRVGAFVQGFGRFVPSPAAPRRHRGTLSRQFIESFHIHSCAFSGSCVEYADLREDFPELKPQFLAGNRVGNVTTRIHTLVDSVRYASVHGSPHTTVIVFAAQGLSPDPALRLSIDDPDLRKALELLELAVVEG